MGMPFTITRIFQTYRRVRRRVYRRRSPRTARAAFLSTSPAYLEHREAALTLVTTKLAEFNAHPSYHFTTNRITIRNQRSRWGSCSRKGGISFNYRIVLLPPHLADYIIVHELCHLGQFNHSRDFWALVAETIPDYLERRRELKKLESAVLHA